LIREALGYTDIPGIASEEQEKAISTKAKTQCKITLSKDKLVNREGLTKQEQFQVDLYDKAIDRLMHKENLITFDKLNSAVSHLFESNHSATAPYKDKYKYIFVDEFQDTDNIQIRFLNSFPNTNFYFCGDTLQNLYSFRGTSNEYIKALANTPDWEVIKLFTNYRSTNQICEYANKFSKKYADPSYRVEMVGTRDGERVITKMVEGPSNYNAINVVDIEDVLTTNKQLSGTSAILCRTNKEVAAITTYLKNRNIPYTSNSDNKIQKLLDCSLSDDYTLGLMASYLSSPKYAEYIRLSSQVQDPNLPWFLNNFGDIAQIRADIRIINELRTIATNFGFTNTKLAAVAKLLNVQEIKPADKEYFGRDFLLYLKDSIMEIKSSELYVGTIHSVKGLEYDNVFVMNVGSYSFRLNNEDMKNLFYVAITRARNRLFVYELFD
jgi:DNA helicase-2/ATP-dependent DNA helicase PcrA